MNKVNSPDAQSGTTKELEQKEIPTAAIPISSLAPKILTDPKDLERVKPYLESIKKAIDTKGINNIALTGGYGSGKSTIIRTFQDRNQQSYKFLNISLASFTENTDQEEKLERKLEISILQQIFYHVKPSEIPDSRFKRIVNITTGKIWAIGVGVVLWVLSLITLFKFNYINKLNPSTWSFEKEIDLYAIPILVIFFVGIGLFSKTVVRLFGNSKINKFNIKGELELGENVDKSVFNQHLEEILYFFERTKYNVVVIEDVDRFESTDIFTKLREINILLNNSNLIGREITFIYAIKDEMFSDKNERVKFFEFIIPVIPFINPSNAGDQLARLIEGSNLKEVLSKDFTEDVITFIDDIDMRLLINIFHEYKLYRENLNKQLPQDELFAMIVYKNMFPKDFGLLPKRQGNLYAFISNKNKYIETQLGIIDQSIQLRSEEIQTLDRELIQNIKELRAIYIYALHTHIPSAINIMLDKVVNFSELLDDDNFNKLQQTNQFQFQRYEFHPNYPNRFHIVNDGSGLNFKSLEQSVNPSVSFSERENKILDNQQKRTEALKSEIEGLRLKRLETEYMSLKEIFQQVPIEPHLSEFGNNLLVRNLLLNGYINENYSDYISLFHEVSITKEDFEFEQKIKSGSNLPFTYTLKHTENLIKKINEKYFRRDVILNYDLFDFLCENSTRFNTKFSAVIKVLSTDKPLSTTFVDGYIERKDNKNVPFFIKSIFKSWDDFWDNLEKANLTEEKINNYLKLVVLHADLEDIVRTNDGAGIGYRISHTPDVLEYANSALEREKVKQILVNLDIRFHHLYPPTTTSKSLFAYTYNNQRYRINWENIELFIKEFSKKTNLEELSSRHYTTILDSDCDALKNYINENLNEYIQDVVLKLSNNSKEAEAPMITLLQSGALDDKTKFTLIDKQELIFQDISKVDSIDIQRYILQQNKVLTSWENLFSYYNKIGEQQLDESLVRFLNDKHNYSQLTKRSLETEPNQPEEFTKAFSKLILKNEQLSLESFKHLIKSIPYRYTSLDLTNISKEKVQCLIDTKFLSLTQSNIDSINGLFPDLTSALLIVHSKETAKTYESLTIPGDSLAQYLTSSKVDLASKKAVIKGITVQTLIQVPEISRAVAGIATNSKELDLGYDTIYHLVQNSMLNLIRLPIINNYGKNFETGQVKSLIDLLGEEYAVIFNKDEKIRFTNTAHHRNLLELLKQKAMIDSYEITKDEKEINVFTNAE